MFGPENFVDGERRRLRGEVQVGGFAGVRPFVVEEEERFVPDDGAADAAAEDVAARIRILLACLLQEVIGRLQFVVLVVLEHASGEVVRPALGDAVHDDAGRAAVFGAVLMRLHLVFGH